MPGTPYGQIVGMALGTIGTIGGNIDSDRLRGDLLRLESQDPNYTQSPYAKEQYDLAKQLLHARMPGATSMERNIYASNANQNQNIDANATNAGQALAAKAGAANAENQQFQGLQQREEQWYPQAYGIYSGAADKMTSEADKAYEDRVRRWQDQVNITMGRGKIKQGEWQSLTNLGGMFAGSGMTGGGGAAGGGGGGAAAGGGGGGGPI